MNTLQIEYPEELLNQIDQTKDVLEQVAREDDSEQAVRAALAIQLAVRELYAARDSDRTPACSESLCG
ncbi:MAG: hypothetical protein SH847_03390 [Roseiflexaceae bacterium]|nr:hypothetical protein [Roseiflexaceae bacterium]